MATMVASAALFSGCISDIKADCNKLMKTAEARRALGVCRPLTRCIVATMMFEMAGVCLVTAQHSL